MDNGRRDTAYMAIAGASHSVTFPGSVNSFSQIGLQSLEINGVSWQ